MIEKAKDGWRKPRSIYRSFFGSGVLTIGVIAVVCLVLVLVCHLFEMLPPEVNALRYTYAHGGMIVAIANMLFCLAAIRVALKLNKCQVYWNATSKSWVEQETSQKARQ